MAIAFLCLSQNVDVGEAAFSSTDLPVAPGVGTEPTIQDLRAIPIQHRATHRA